MNKQSLALLERAFHAEVESAVTKQGSGLLHTKSKLAQKLVEEGYLEHAQWTLPGRFPVVVEGLSLTHLGRMTYFMSCEGGNDGKY